MTRRACVGAGFPHGLAGDASRAIGWLCGHGLPGLEGLLQLLENCAPDTLCRAGPLVEGDVWRWSGSTDAPLSPLELGPALAELPLAAGQDRPVSIEFGHMLVPLVLLPSAAVLAARLGQAVSLTIKLPDGASVYLLQPDGAVHGPADPHAADRQAAVHADLACEGAPDGKPLDGDSALANGVPTPDALWSALNAYAYRGYVAATEESRLLGAGAGLTDND